MSGAAASTAAARYADAFARREAALPDRDSADPWKVAADT